MDLIVYGTSYIEKLLNNTECTEEELKYVRELFVGGGHGIK